MKKKLVHQIYAVSKIRSLTTFYYNVTKLFGLVLRGFYKDKYATTNLRSNVTFSLTAKPSTN